MRVELRRVKHERAAPHIDAYDVGMAVPMQCTTAAAMRTEALRRALFVVVLIIATES